MVRLLSGLRGDVAEGLVDRVKDGAGVFPGHRRRQREQAVAGGQDAAAKQTLVEGVELPVLGRTWIDLAVSRDGMRREMNLE